MPFVAEFLLLVALKTALTSILSYGAKTTDGYLKNVLSSPLEVMVISPVIEELLFRLFAVLLGASHPFDWLMLSSSALFAVLHLKNFDSGHLLQAVKYFLVACIYAWVAIHWGIGYAILMHMLNNALGYCHVLLKQKNQTP